VAHKVVVSVVVVSMWTMTMSAALARTPVEHAYALCFVMCVTEGLGTFMTIPLCSGPQQCILKPTNRNADTEVTDMGKKDKNEDVSMKQRLADEKLIKQLREDEAAKEAIRKEAEERDKKGK